MNKLNTDCFCLLICCISVCVCTHNLTLQTLSHLWMWWKVRVVCLFKATCCWCISTEFICDLRGWAAVSQLDWWTNKDDVHKISFWMTNPSVTGSDLCWYICRNKRWRTQPSEEQMKPEEKSFCVMTWTENCVDDSALKHWGLLLFHRLIERNLWVQGFNSYHDRERRWRAASSWAASVFGLVGLHPIL